MEDVLLVLVGQEVEKKQEFKVQTVKVQTLRRRGVLLEAHTSFHPCNGLGFGVAQKVEGFAVGLIGIA